jgi:hypothetical protein
MAVGNQAGWYGFAARLIDGHRQRRRVHIAFAIGSG